MTKKKKMPEKHFGFSNYRKRDDQNRICQKMQVKYVQNGE